MEKAVGVQCGSGVLSCHNDGLSKAQPETMEQWNNMHGSTCAWHSLRVKVLGSCDGPGRCVRCISYMCTHAWACYGPSFPTPYRKFAGGRGSAVQGPLALRLDGQSWIGDSPVRPM